MEEDLILMGDVLLSIISSISAFSHFRQIKPMTLLLSLLVYRETRILTHITVGVIRMHYRQIRKFFFSHTGGATLE